MVRVGDAMGTAGDKEWERGCGVALTVEVAACVSKGWDRASGWRGAKEQWK